MVHFTNHLEQNEALWCMPAVVVVGTRGPSFADLKRRSWAPGCEGGMWGSGEICLPPFRN